MGCDRTEPRDGGAVARAAEPEPGGPLAHGRVGPAVVLGEGAQTRDVVFRGARPRRLRHQRVDAEGARDFGNQAEIPVFLLRPRPAACHT